MEADSEPGLRAVEIGGRLRLLNGGSGAGGALCQAAASSCFNWRLWRAVEGACSF